MLVNINITLDLPAETHRLFQLCELITPADSMTTLGQALTPAGNGRDGVAGGAQVTPTEPVAVTEPIEPPKERRPHRAVKPATIAAKAAKTTKPDPSGLADSDDEPETPAAEDLNGPVDPDDDDALGLAAPSMTPAEALELGLGKVRAIYAKGHKAPVKALQQKLGIAKFTDIPPTEGHNFLGMVIKLEEQVGMRV
jgi:hypothetical protein